MKSDTQKSGSTSDAAAMRESRPQTKKEEPTMLTTPSVTAERIKNLEAKEQVLFDIHEALGIKWGDDPYNTIKQLRERSEGVRNET